MHSEHIAMDVNDLERTRQEVLSYGLSFPGTYQDAPFHDENWQLVRVKKNKKAFLWTYEKDGQLMKFSFEPSERLLKRIYDKVNIKNVKLIK